MAIVLGEVGRRAFRVEREEEGMRSTEALRPVSGSVTRIVWGGTSGPVMAKGQRSMFYGIE